MLKGFWSLLSPSKYIYRAEGLYYGMVICLLVLYLYSLAHCISADAKMIKRIVLPFVVQFPELILLRKI